MTFIRRDTTRKGWKPNKNGAGRVMQINSTSDQKKVMYIELEDVANIQEDASLMLSDKVKDACLKLWWLQNYYGCWLHFFKARITWAQAKDKIVKSLGTVTDPATGKPIKMYAKE